MQLRISTADARPKSLVLAVAAYVEDDGPKPPELDYWLYRNWGAPEGGGWLDWPAGEFARARAAANIYVAMSGYMSATNKVIWCDTNPNGWKVVSYVFALQNEGLNG